MMTVLEERACNALIALRDKLCGSKDIDWEQRRYEIAKDLFVHLGGYEDAAANAVSMADTLIEELKKEPNNPFE